MNYEEFVHRFNQRAEQRMAQFEKDAAKARASMEKIAATVKEKPQPKTTAQQPVSSAPRVGHSRRPRRVQSVLKHI